MDNPIAGLVLAGGRSRRMGGGDKFLLQLEGETLVGRAIRRLAPQVGRLAISANCDPEILSDFPNPVLPDAPPAGRGPLAGILAGLDWAGEQAGISHILTVASDTPFFPADLAARLSAKTGGNAGQIVLAASGGRGHPVFGLWPVTLREALREWLDNGKSLKVTDFTDRHACVLCEFDSGWGGDPFFNINTPDDLAAAARLASEAPR